MSANRYFKFENNWNEIVEMIRENDKLAQVDIWSRHFDDIDWNQGKESNGLVDGEGNQVLGGSYIPVEKMNARIVGKSDRNLAFSPDAFIGQRGLDCAADQHFQMIIHRLFFLCVFKIDSQFSVHLPALSFLRGRRSSRSYFS